jgi:hypothetical protein
MKEIQKEHMKKYSNVTFYFIEYKKIYPRFEIEENTLTINGVESRMGILQKTIDALEIMFELKVEFDYMIRSNISTIIDFSKLENELSKITSSDLLYGSAYFNVLLWLDYPSGIVDSRHYGTKYASGTSIIFNNALTHLFIESKDKLDFSVIDDLSIGLFVNSLPLVTWYKAPGWVVNPTTDKEIQSGIVFRNMSNIRENDVVAMKRIVSLLK